MKKTIALLALTVFMFAFKKGDTTSWSLDKNYAKLGFTVNHLAVCDIEGWFTTFSAKIIASKDDFSDAVAQMSADVSSINTANEKRDEALKSPDFFDEKTYPEITFKSKTFTKVDDKNYKITGDLTLHGITKTIELNATCTPGTNPANKKTIAGFKITGTINRSDFGIGAGTPTSIVSDEVKLIANAEFIKG